MLHRQLESMRLVFMPLVNPGGMRAGTRSNPRGVDLMRNAPVQALGRDFAVALDCHSGFGLRDRIWFPYAHTPRPIEHLPEIHALKHLFDASYPHHDYIFEPQSRHYLAHGDLWDHLYQRALGAGSGVFLPLTLEMGSWRWVKKRPSQIFTRLGMFNPLPAHRQQRVLRSHLVWLEFLSRVGCAWQTWLPDGAERLRHEQAALSIWYPRLDGLRPLNPARA